FLPLDTVSDGADKPLDTVSDGLAGVPFRPMVRSFAMRRANRFPAATLLPTVNRPSLVRPALEGAWASVLPSLGTVSNGERGAEVSFWPLDPGCRRRSVLFCSMVSILVLFAFVAGLQCLLSMGLSVTGQKKKGPVPNVPPQCQP